MYQPYLKEAISRVMETMFFMPVQFVDGPQPLGDWFSREAKVLESLIDFQGSRSGRGVLLVPARGLKEMAANFLGLREAEVGEEQMRDTLREAVNMITGQMLSLWDKGGGYALGIPQFAGERTFPDLQEEKGSAMMLRFETEKTHLAAGVSQP
jgi:hypothetical protein